MMFKLFILKIYQSQYKQCFKWPIEKGQIDKQRSTNHTLKAKARATRSPLKTGGELINIFLSSDW
jgi:hypothetical protein